MYENFCVTLSSKNGKHVVDIWLEDEIQQWLPIIDALVREKAMPLKSGLKTFL
jgi:folate-binding Fe-S cluster repair protein YgfZ